MFYYLVQAVFTLFTIIFGILFYKSRSIKNRHVVVSGGSSGIGLWVAIHCAKLGAHVTIIGQNVQKLKSAVEKIESHRANDNQLILYRSIDLSRDIGAIESMLHTFEQEIGPIFMLISCTARQTSDEHSAGIPIDPLFNAVYFVTQSVFKKIKKRGNGIVTIAASKATVNAMPPAAEFALRGLAESIKPNLWNFQIFTNLALVEDIGKVLY